MKVAVLADTHAPRYWKACPPAVARRLERVDLILHAGDVCRAPVLEELVVFGHSHIPLDLVLGSVFGSVFGSAEEGVRIFNPGSPTDRRRQPRGTMGLLRVEGGRLLETRIVPVT